MKKRREHCIEITIETVQIVTIVTVQSLPSNSRELGSVSDREDFTAFPEGRQDHFMSRFQNPEGSREETENAF